MMLTLPATRATRPRQPIRWLRTTLTVLFLLATALGSLALFGSGGGDDSHITWWVVDELRRTGHFHNFNGVALEQSSSLALVLIAALFRYLVPVATPALGVGLSILAMAGTSWMTGRLASRLDPRLRFPAMLLVASSGPLVYWSTSGMETALAAFANVWLLDAVGQCLSRLPVAMTAGRIRQTCVAIIPASALFVSVRPENPLLLVGTLVGGLLCWAILLFAGRAKYDPNAFRHVQLIGACALLPAVALFLWRHWVFREWFPHPVTAKGSGGARWRHGWEYLLRHTTDFQPTMLLLPIAIGVVLVAVWCHRAKAINLGLAVFATLGVAFICASGGDWMSCGRFLAPQLPVWWLTVLIALSVCLRRSLIWLRASVAVLALANGWFLFGLARSGGTNGYPLNAALKVVPAAKAQYALDGYPFIELANKSHLRDALLSEELKRVVEQVRRENPDKIWLASGQAGAVPYHVFRAFPDQLRFIDFWGLTSSEAIPCIPQSKLKHSSLGVAASPELMFEYRDAIWRDCHVPQADIVFNTGLRSGTKKGLEARGYRVVYFQRGAMPSFAEPGLLRGGTSMDAYIAVRRELADKLHLRYREVRWSLAG